MRYRKPEELKETDVEWIGKIPINWSCTLLRRKIKGHKQGYYTTDSYIQEGIKLVRITDLNEKGDISYKDMPYVPINSKDYQDFKIEKEDFLFPRTGSIGLFGVVKDPEKAVFASYLIRFKFNESLSSNFLKYYFQSLPFEHGIKRNLHGGVNQNIHAEDIKNQYLVIPSQSQQRTIAAFLDRKTEAIDGLIQKKEQLIERLKEKRQALITQAVTKGLAPDVPMKDSGLMWLDKIPEHWEVHQLRRVVEKFVDYRGSTPNKIDSGIPLITAANIDDEKIDFSDVEVYISEEEYEERMVRGFPKKGDVLVTTEAPLGEVAQIEEEKVALAQRIILFKTRENLSDDFLLYYLLSGCGQSELKSRATGSTALGIKGSKLKGIEIVVPPLQEQRKIAEFVNSESKKVFSSISKLNKQIEKLKEYRQSLISAAVTGKIDVRSSYAEASADRDEIEVGLER